MAGISLIELDKNLQFKQKISHIKPQIQKLFDFKKVSFLYCLSIARN
jgi:hypothetical protein